MPTRTINTKSPYTIAFLLNRETGYQVDLHSCDVELTVIPYHHHYGAGDSMPTALIRTNIVCTVTRMLDRKIAPSFAQLLRSQSKEWVLSVGQEERAFHVPLLLNYTLDELVGRVRFDTMHFLGLGGVIEGLHIPDRRVVRFDRGDGELHLIKSELVPIGELIERWYNRQGVWKW